MEDITLNYLIIFISILITTLSQIFISLAYSKYKKILNNKDLSGYDVARKILDSNNLDNIMILETRGNLTDHYDPQRKVIKLSTDIYHGSSIAGAAVAAHECGHAIQDKMKYTPMRIRSTLVPFVNICTRIGYLAIVIGIIFSYTLIEVERLNLIDEEEKSSAKNMLIAAAFTYVASVLSTLLEILRYALIFNDRDR